MLYEKENLNSASQQFHKYQLETNSHLTPQINEHRQDHDIWPRLGTDQSD